MILKLKWKSLQQGVVHVQKNYCRKLVGRNLKLNTERVYCRVLPMPVSTSKIIWEVLGPVHRGTGIRLSAALPSSGTVREAAGSSARHRAALAQHSAGCGVCALVTMTNS